MAHHQQNNHDRMRSYFATTSLGNSGAKNMADDEEVGADVDEPPDRQLKFSKMTHTGSHNSDPEPSHMSPRYRKASLLTQALTSPELTPLSDNEAPVLTSDGGITSPARTNTPSPPLPALGHPPITPLEPKDFLDAKQEQELVQLPEGSSVDRTPEMKVEEELGRRRCISFACFQKKTPQTVEDKTAETTPTPNESVSTVAKPPKRPCMLRFACPMKPTRSESQETAKPQRAEKLLHDTECSPTTFRPAESSQAALPTAASSHQESPEANRKHEGINENGAATSLLSPGVSLQDRRLRFNRVDFQKSEATRFHEFAGSFADEDEWANEQTAFRQKITINDTLRKENAIRKLAEEAEEEAREEDEDPYDNADGDLDEASDDGNETDDEEGFADSDDESDGGSAYQFWTPGSTTAATSTDHVEHIRPKSHRVASESSIESVIDASLRRDESSQTDGKKIRKASRPRKDERSNPPDLLDSSDFVVGTIDEDRPFEEEYMSRLKQKERSKQKIIPQDIDPSFPTSDPEAERDDDDEPEDEEENEDKDTAMVTNDTSRVADCARSSDEDDSVDGQSSLRAKRTIPNPSPRRLQSPPPSHRLFGQAVHRLRSPPPMHRKLVSPPSSRRPSFSGSPGRTRGIDITRLAQRPNLTHTTSLPRTPNPFWRLHRPSEFRDSGPPSAGTSPKTPYPMAQDVHRRGPIEIVQGLENKRQRRKEKFWRQQCSKAHAGKEKERRCQPGKGAQRMREVGLVMADRFKGYKQDTKLVLSV